MTVLILGFKLQKVFPSQPIGSCPWDGPILQTGPRFDQVDANPPPLLGHIADLVALRLNDRHGS
jgi:hypothetical protein